MKDYAMVLLRDQDVNFKILHVKKPCEGGACSGKCNFIFTNKLNKEVERLQNLNKSNFTFTQEFVEGAYIESIRQIISREKIDLIILGNSQSANKNNSFYLDQKTLDIITKVKCSVLLVPGNTEIKPPTNFVLPTDFSVNFEYRIFDILRHLEAVQNQSLLLLEMKSDCQLKDHHQRSKKQIDLIVNEIGFEKITTCNQKSKDFKISSEFDFMLILAKNLSIFNTIFQKNSSQYYHSQLPVLFLHG
ncbi:adenine nucleotide alpha hydrolase family protein [Psychroflexus aestuariivivens]|uniref:hypothetical protein n=1 Tax=Psychroflexus aestuariivivens TaxID=1795040 RepID=UPI001EFF9C85